VDEFSKYHMGLRDHLRRHFVVRVAALPEGHDPASVPSESLVSAARAAKYLL
jgi:hypothetical protein